ncbi:hypothetical protein NYE70_04460 [Paenibacillus sp. FSL R5-0407]|uniref:hypothetical protein n=1 Tax=Paenibacillus TaxID=44249 RepID=UPI0025B641BB|nr:hypothetical protein [Paenibacillus vini]MDN4068764.1 hypothetical protein [Paenibacillus vini]
MKRTSILISIAVGLGSILLLAALLKVNIVPINEGMQHRQAWHEPMRYGHHGVPLHMNSNNAATPASGAKPVWHFVLQIAVLLGGVTLFLKGKGGLKWTGAVFAVLSTMSLLTPLWGLVVLIIAFLLYRRIENNRKYISPQAINVYPSFVETTESRGRFLDEWERKQHKEE